jgi:glycosyltransferase involved in cell wall biosynthesis
MPRPRRAAVTASQPLSAGPVWETNDIAPASSAARTRSVSGNRPRHYPPAPMDVLVFHGYLLRGTGSNVYNAELAMALARLGHRVHLLSQEPRPLELPWVDAAGVWEDGSLRIETRNEPARITVYRPPIGSVLPVYVADRYEGFDARPFAELSDTELDAYLERNVEAVRDVAERVAPEAALANHLVMGPVVLVRAGVAPYAVKVHGSALEYTVKPEAGRFLPFAREGLAGASGVLVGSRHTAESLWAAMEDPDLPARTRLGPPGVDVHAFTPRPPDAAAAGLARLAGRLKAEQAAAPGDDSFARDAAAAGAALSGLDPRRDRVVAFVGKLIFAKGVDLLLAAWPRVLAALPDARLVVVGFGADRGALEALATALAAGRPVDTAGLRYLRAFLERAARDPAYCAAAARIPETVRFTGRLEHEELADLLPACEALVVPSSFPEAFGMVAAEAAACGALPVSAQHSGLAEVSRVLAAGLSEPARRWLSFPLGDEAVDGIAARLIAWLEAPEPLRRSTREALAATAREQYSWEGVARGVLAAARGRLDALPAP